jgi:transcriptional regulator with XRE-family HTH domain/tetratricopeptide (TPR) repeat protein
VADDASFGPELRRLRYAAGLTLEELAEASGVSVRAIGDMERSRSRSPQRRTAEAITAALGLTGADQDRLLALARAGRRQSAGALRLPCGLPRPIGDFAGRDAEIGVLGSIAEATVAGPGAAITVVVSGSAGLGKTTLAVYAADRLAAQFRDGLFYVNLRGLDDSPLDPREALSRLLRALGASNPLPAGLPERASQYRSLLQDKNVLVILDNAANEAQVRPLLPGVGRSMVIVTSRRLLTGLEGVRRLPLPPLAAADAAGLLQGILGGSEPAPPPADLAEVAALCECLPLALRIAGNRLASRPGWTVRTLADRLADEGRRLDRLSAGDLRLSTAFSLSHDQLSAPAQLMFRRVAMVPGPDFSVELAAVLTGSPVDDAEALLEELTELGLLEALPTGRFAFHDLIRLFARTRLARADSPAQRAAAGQQMDDWLLDVTITAGRWFEPGYGAPPADWPELVPLPSAAAAERWLQAEAPNWLAALRAAAGAGRAEQVVTVAESLHWFSDRWMYWGHWPEVFSLSRNGARQLGDRGLEATHLNYLAWAQSACQGRHEHGVRSALEAAALAASAGDRRQQGWARFYAACARMRGDQPAAALEFAREAAELLRQAGDKDGRSQAMASAAISLGRAGQHAEAVAAWRDVYQILDDPAHAPEPSVALWTRAVSEEAACYAALGQRERAVDSFEARLAAAGELGIPNVEARVLVEFADLRQEMRETGEADRLRQRAIGIYAAIGEDHQAQRTRERLSVR